MLNQHEKYALESLKLVVFYLIRATKLSLCLVGLANVTEQ